MHKISETWRPPLSQQPMARVGISIFGLIKILWDEMTTRSTAITPGGSPPAQFSALPRELRSHIGGYVPVRQARIGSRALDVEAQDLVRELRSLGLDPAEIVAKERLRLRELQRLQKSKAYPLYQLLTSRGYHYYLESHRGILIITVDGELPALLEQMGYVVDVQTYPNQPDIWVTLFLPNRNPNQGVITDQAVYSQLFEDIVRIFEAVDGPRSRVGEDSFDIR